MSFRGNAIVKIKKREEWLQGIGLLGIMTSLIFVGLQLRQTEEIAEVGLAESSVTWGIELSSLISDHAEVWHKACMGEELSPPERVIAGNIYWRYTQGNLNSWVRMETTNVGRFDSSFITASFAANIHRYPGFRKMAESWDDWTRLGVPLDSPLIKKFREEILTRVSELREQEPNPNANVMWCGVR